jgi:kynureninase
LHLLMVSFYKPKGARKKILIEETAFPSDEYAVKSQLKFHGLNPDTDLIKCPTTNEGVLEAIKKHESEIALVMIGNVNYLTGYAFDLKSLATAAHQAGAIFGVDLAHGIGNLELNLHEDHVDFATWCSYKYLNAGPGGISGIYVNEKWGLDPKTFQFAGWWGHDKKTRFKMGPDFSPIGGAESWQLSNPPILQLAALRASLDLFDKAKIGRLRKKSESLVAFMELGLRQEIPEIKITTPAEKQKRGTQLSLDISNAPKNLTAKLLKLGLVCDFREPNILRLAPAPLYTRYIDVFHALAALKKGLS